MSELRTRRLCAMGVFLALLGLYLLTAPGRIEIIDGQWRHEGAKNWLDDGEAPVTDRHLLLTEGHHVDRGTGPSLLVSNAGPNLPPVPHLPLSRLLPRPRVVGL